LPAFALSSQEGHWRPAAAINFSPDNHEPALRPALDLPPAIRAPAPIEVEELKGAPRFDEDWDWSDRDSRRTVDDYYGYPAMSSR
jgi:hypothetical protein